MELITDPVDVYFNFHRGVWSLRSRKSGLVIAHARVVAFAHGARMAVQASGRRRVLETGHKTVHAFVRGEDAEASEDVAGWRAFGQGLPDICRARYNPRRAGYFTRDDTGERIDSASALVMVAPAGEPPEVWAVPA